MGIPIVWVEVPYANCTFTASAGTWTVDAGDLLYLRYATIGRLIFIRGAIVTTDVSAAPLELRLAIAGINFGAQDAFGFSVLTDATGFATQDTGQAIARAATDLIAFKKRDGAAWTLTAGDNTGVIFSLTAELNTGNLSATSATRVVVSAPFPPKREQLVIIVDPGVTATSKINIWASGLAESDLNGSDGVDLLAIRTRASTGQFTAEIQTLTPWAGTLAVDYTVSA